MRVAVDAAPPWEPYRLEGRPAGPYTLRVRDTANVAVAFVGRGPAETEALAGLLLRSFDGLDAVVHALVGLGAEVWSVRAEAD